MRKLIAKTLVASIVAVVFVGVPAGAAPKAKQTRQALSPVYEAHHATCSHPSVPGAYRCTSQAWGSHGGVIGVETLLYASAPVSFDASSSARIVHKAVHTLSGPVRSVTYRWDFRPYTGSNHTEGTGGSAFAYGAVDLSAVHSACATCVASMRQVMLGDDPADASPATGNDFSGIGFQPMVLEIVLTNPSGGPLPAGNVDVRIGLQGHSSLDADPAFSGGARNYMSILSDALTAQTSY